MLGVDVKSLLNEDAEFEEDEEDTIDEPVQLSYQISSSVSTPYRSCSQTAVMRAVSSNSEEEDDFILPV
jgi:hypothetical protein